MNKQNLINTQNYANFWSEICQTEMFKNMYEWKIHGELAFLNFQARMLDHNRHRNFTMKKY